MRRPEFDRDEVLDRAMRVFWEKGYFDTSIQDLSDATGLQRSSIYAAFKSKHELYLSALRRYHAQKVEMCAEIESAEYPFDALKGFVRSIVANELEDGDGLGCLVANATLEFSGRDKQVNALTSRNLTMLAQTIEAAIRSGQIRGSVRKDMDPAVAARSVVVTIQGLRVIAKGIDSRERETWLHSASDSCLASLAA